MSYFLLTTFGGNMKKIIGLLGLLIILVLVSCNETVTTYTITWEVDGTIVETDEVLKGEMPKYNGVTPVRASTDTYEYKFSGWSPEIYAADKDQKYVAEFESIKKEIKVKVIFNTNGGSNISNQNLNKYDKAVKPADPTREGYIFVGWFSDFNLTKEYDFTLPVTTDLTLYAKWEGVYAITFNTNGGSVVASQTVIEGNKVIEPEDPTREGYNFVGWYLDSELLEAYDFNSEVTSNLALYAKWNEKIPLGDYLEMLLSSYELDPYSYIPTSLQPSFNANLVDSNLSYDFSDFVDVADIIYGGFGEQWNMVVENLNQSQMFFKILAGLDAITSVSITAFNNYLDSNPADTISFNFKQGIYDVLIEYKDNILYYVLDFTTTIPLLGEQTIEIMLQLDVLSGSRIGRVQVGDANALKYEMTENSYTFAIRYAGVRRAYFNISKDEDGVVSGHIYEYLGVDGVYEKGSCADFYIDDTYLTVVGNKASGIIGFKGYICEIYNIESGKLLAYEVQETLSVINYDTLWFNLDDVEGINNIKVVEGSREDNKNNPYTIYINNSYTPFKVKNGSIIDPSRRYDIELRRQYFYTYNEGTEEYEQIEVLIPMFFVQADYYDDVINDVANENNDLAISFTNNVLDNLEYLETQYRTLIPVFIENKDKITVEMILEYIGEKYKVEQIA